MKANILKSVSHAAVARGFCARNSKYQLIILPKGVDLSSWNSVAGVLLSRFPGGDGRPAELHADLGMYIPPLEEIIRSFDVSFNANWISEKESVGRLSIVMIRKGAINELVEDDNMAPLFEMVDRWASSEIVSERHAADYFSEVPIRSPNDFIGLGYAFILIRYFLFNEHFGITSLPRTEILKRAHNASAVDFMRMQHFFSWWDGMVLSGKLA